MKQVIQLDAAGYFVGITIADESPLEPGVFLLPAGTVDADAPVIPDGKKAKWEGAWVFEDIPQPEPVVEPSPMPPTNEQQVESRKAAYEQEADPIFFMSQRGEATVAEWEAKIAEIKARYPYQE